MTELTVFKLLLFRKERWKPIEGYPNYSISDKGRVKNSLGRFLRPQLDGQKKYLNYQVCKDGKPKHLSVSRLVAIHFVPNPFNKPEVNHKNGNRRDNRYNNLEWCTPSENSQHACNTGLKKPTVGELCGRAKFTNEEARRIREEFNPSTDSYTSVSRKYGVSRLAISSIIKGKTYKEAA